MRLVMCSAESGEVYEWSVPQLQEDAPIHPTLVTFLPAGDRILDILAAGDMSYAVGCTSLILAASEGVMRSGWCVMIDGWLMVAVAVSTSVYGWQFNHATRAETLFAGLVPEGASVLQILQGSNFQILVCGTAGVALEGLVPSGE